MGYYINQNSKGNAAPSKGKVDFLLQDGAKVIQPTTFQENIVCVVDNGLFEAAAYMYNEQEFKYFQQEIDEQRKVFLTYPYAKELAK